MLLTEENATRWFEEHGTGTMVRSAACASGAPVPTASVNAKPMPYRCRDMSAVYFAITTRHGNGGQQAAAPEMRLG